MQPSRLTEPLVLREKISFFLKKPSKQKLVVGAGDTGTTRQLGDEPNTDVLVARVTFEYILECKRDKSNVIAF